MGMTEHKNKLMQEEQFSSTLRAMVLVSIILFKAGYFLGFLKCSLIPEKSSPTWGLNVIV